MRALRPCIGFFVVMMKSYLLVVLFIAVMAAAPLSYPGPLQTHAGFTPLYALSAHDDDLHSAETVGMLPSLIASVLPWEPLDALKSLDVLAFVLGAVGMFLLARHFYGNAAGLAAATLYSMLPYRLMTTYVRGAAGESLFWGLLPGLLFVLFKLDRPGLGDLAGLPRGRVGSGVELQRQRDLAGLPRGRVGSGVELLNLEDAGVELQRQRDLAGLSRGRVGSGVELLNLEDAGVELQRQRDLAGLSRKKVFHFAFAALSTLGLLLVWRLCVPFAPDPSQAPVYLFQIFSASWNYGSRGDWLDAVPLQLGIAPLGLSIVALGLRLDRSALNFAAGAAILTLLSIVPFSQWWPWALWFNEPWQLLGAAGLLLSLLGGSVLARDKRLQSMPALAIVITLTVLASYPYLEPRGLDYTPTHPPLARFGNQAYLVDVQAPAIEPNTTVTVTLLWQDIQPFADDYKVFVHVIDSQEKIWAQRDTPPLNGSRLTRSWQRGELLRDEYVIAIPPNAPRGLTIAIGLYRADNGIRLKTARGDDRVIIKS